MQNSEGFKNEEDTEIVLVGVTDLAFLRATLLMGQRVTLIIDLASPQIDWEGLIQLADEYQGLRILDTWERPASQPSPSSTV